MRHKTGMVYAAVTLMAATPAFAHDNGVLHAAGFASGFMHPLYGLDHLLAMAAVGWWATQNQRRAVWILPMAFSAMLMAGLILGISGVRFPVVESGVAVSVLALGLLIAFAVRLPVGIGAALIGSFALLHGQVHGAEMQPGASAGAYAAGLMCSTIALHAAGVVFGRTSLSIRLARMAGSAIVGAGAWMLAIA